MTLDRTTPTFRATQPRSHTVKITRTLAVLAATAAVTACAVATDGEPTEPTARPVIEQPDTSGPGRLATDEALRGAVRDFAPWLLPR